MSELLYSIIIPTYNNHDYLCNCLNTVFKYSPGAATEIIVIDNGSTDIYTKEYLNQVAGQNPERFRVITNETNTGFCTATNQGMEVAKGRYLVWLNDDTLVPPMWLERMRANIEDKDMEACNVGMTGPISNNVGGSQHISNMEGPPPVTTENYLMVDGGLANSAAQDPADPLSTLTQFLSGFCLMLKREVMDSIGVIDADLYSPGGFCDNDYCLRAIEAGFSCILSRNVLVYHFGSVTLNAEYPEMYSGLANWAKYISKFRNVAKKKLLLIQRVKIDDEFNLTMYKDCAYRNKKFVDGVVILSDRSDNFTYEDAKNIFGDKLVQWYQNKKENGFDEIRDRLAILDAARDHPEFDWVIILDHDECFERGATKERLQRMMNPYNPTTFSYYFNLNTYWKSLDFARADGNWGQMIGRRMWRNNIFASVLRKRQSEDDPGLHCGASPLSIPVSAGTVSTIQLDHYGYVEEGSNQRKRDFYENLDTLTGDVAKELVGEEGYRHLTDESEMQMITPNSFTISANLMVKNEEKNLGVFILTYADALDELCVIDTGSTDKTKEMLKQVGIPFKEMPLNDDFSAVRNELISMTTSDYCFHLDADEMPVDSHMYFKQLLWALNRSPDLILAELRNVQKNGTVISTRQPRIFRKDLGVYYYGRVHETLDQSISDMHENNIPIKVSPVHVQSVNNGFLINDEALDKKLIMYGRLLEKEISEHPNNVKARFEFSLHLLNIGLEKEAEEMLDTALGLRPDYVMAARELSLLHIRRAKRALSTLAEVDTGDKALQQFIQQLYSDLSKYAPKDSHTVGNPNVQLEGYRQSKETKLRAVS